MDSPVSSSFIPHDTAQMVTTSPRARPMQGISEIFLMISAVLFGASLAVGAGVFLYAQYLGAVSASKLSQLERAKAALDPSLIVQLTRLDDRMNAADALLATHLAPAAFFDALGQATLLSVSFGTLDADVPDARHVNLKMTGIAQSVNSIALQAELFGKNGVIMNPIFSGIGRREDGVHFNLSASVNPAAIGWARIVSTASTTVSIPDASSAQPAASAAPPSPFEGSRGAGGQ